jgi:hypothetical protein
MPGPAYKHCPARAHKKLYTDDRKVFPLLKNKIYVLVVVVSLLPAIVIAQTDITSISQNSDIIGRYDKFELTFTLSESYSNPFDIDIVDIMVTITKPDSNTADVPAFFYEEYDEDSNGNFINGRNPCWKVRFSASELGIYKINQIAIMDHNGTNMIDPNITFACLESDGKGIIRVDRRDHYYMQYDNNESYIPIGHNVSWLADNGSSHWKETFALMSGVGENWTRIWMTHFYQGTSLEWKSSKKHYGGVGMLSLPIACKLDRIIESCEQHGIAIQLVLQHHGQFSTNVNPNWNDNPYNIIYAATDGGFLGDPAEFFTNEKARRITKYKYRYIVARWGYSGAILAWELFNEVEYTNGWQDNPATVVAWHNEMASYINSVDPFDHLITTSSDKSGFEDIWSQEDMDLIQVHYYRSHTINFLEEAATRLSSYNKPIVMGEFGRYDRSDANEGRLVLHNGIWSAFHVKSGGHMWWWDDIEKYNFYEEFSALSVYAEGEDPASYNLSKADISSSSLPLWASAIPGLTDFWAVSTQTVFTVEPDGSVAGMGNLSQWLHGTSKDDLGLRSDPTFNIDMNDSGVLRIHVEEVSGWGNNSLRVLMDGGQVFSSSYPNESTDFIIEVPITAGQHIVQIENTGQDWFCISDYEFKENDQSDQGHLRFLGLCGDDHTYIWIYDVAIQSGETPHGTFADVNFVLNGLADGYYIIEAYETRGSGGVIYQSEVYSANAELVIDLPDFAMDIAVKVRPLCIVDFDDIESFSSQWLQDGSGLKANLDGIGRVDFLDYSIFAIYWLDYCPANWPLE